MNKKDLYNLYGETSNGIENYLLIDRNNIDELELGMHIKYIKYGNDKIYNGGFLKKIIDLDKNKLVNTILILKSNIIWKMRFLKYTIYAKKIKSFNRKNNIINQIKENNKEIINKKNNDLINYIDNKLLEIKSNKNNYKLQF